MYDRNNRTADDGSTKYARSGIGEFTKVFGRQREDGREHDGVEEADGKQRPHSDVGIAFTGHHGDDEQDNSDSGIEGKVAVGRDFRHNCRAEEASDHGAAPVERQVLGGGSMIHPFQEAQDIDHQ